MGSAGMIRGTAGALALILAFAAPLEAGPTRKRRARTAVRYIVTQQKNNGSISAFSPVGSTADAVVSMVAARRAPRQIDRALAYLARQVNRGNVEGVGLISKVVMAAVAGGRNPRRFGGSNLVRALKRSETAEGRLGGGTPVFDHALGLLALIAAGSEPSANATSWLVAAQCRDGGWQFDRPAAASEDDHCVDPADPNDFFASDTNTTGLAVQALEATQDAPTPAVDPFAFFSAIRDDRFGGWGYSWGFETTDSNSTSMVLQAYAAAGRDVPSGAGRALVRLQYRLCGPSGGAFAFTWIEQEDGTIVKDDPNLGATIAAVMGLLREPLPLPPARVTKPAPARRSC
ncbi:MAG TPA: hypothetical protein VM784_06375 [Actinomycetota bacterium]|nr:hypothetical protein [Actinomycetota bacterium]